MTEPSSSHEELRALRLAAEQRDWNGCRDASKKLLLRLACGRALLLTRDHVMRRLPVFERHHPSVQWPREFIESIGGGPASIKQAWPEQEDEFRGPGANNFTTAVESLWKASRLTADEQQCASELVNALSGAIMAESTEAWGSRHHDEWALWYQLASSGESDPRISAIQLVMARDSEAAAVQRTGWLEVAERLEGALREG
jgi:hypothetical protein